MGSRGHSQGENAETVMSLDILLVLGLLGIATLLFTLEWLSVDLVTLLLLTALILLRILTPEEAFAGFGNEIIIILSSIFVLSGVLENRTHGLARRCRPPARER